MTIEQEVKAIDEQIKRLLCERAALTEDRIDYLDYSKLSAAEETLKENRAADFERRMREHIQAESRGPLVDQPGIEAIQ